MFKYMWILNLIIAFGLFVLAPLNLIEGQYVLAFGDFIIGLINVFAVLLQVPNLIKDTDA